MSPAAGARTDTVVDLAAAPAGEAAAAVATARQAAEGAPGTAVPPLEIEDLTVAYRDRPALWDIDLTIPGGRLAAIIGPNGAGKSTLISSLPGRRTCTSAPTTWARSRCGSWAACACSTWPLCCSVTRS